MMNQEIKKKWIASLRNPDYPQGRLRLTEIFPNLKTLAESMIEKDCCLGNLCRIVIPDKKVIEEHTPGFNITVFWDENENALSESVIDLVGLKETDPMLGLPNFKTRIDDYFLSDVTCSFANDTLELSFAQIADIIEWNTEF